MEVVMKVALAVFLMCLTASAQSKPTPKTKPDPATTFHGCDKDHPTDCIALSNVFLPPNDHGCGWNRWDAEKKVCAIYATFGSYLPPVTCSPVAASPDGTQHMICWYKPTEAAK